MSTIRPGYWIALALAVALWLASRTEKGQAVVAEATNALASNVRGIRNNNPGNVRLTGDQWQGMSATQTDGAFVQFDEMRYGVRAACKVFRNYQSKYGLRTITQLISRWAPPSENDTAAYAEDVASRVGVDAGAIISLTNEDTAYDFLCAVFRHECGIAAELIPESTIREGIDLA